MWLIKLIRRVQTMLAMIWGLRVGVHVEHPRDVGVKRYTGGVVDRITPGLLRGTWGASQRPAWVRDVRRDYLTM